MLRRLVLVGLMVLYQGTMMQLVVGGMLAALFLLLQVQASPFKETTDDFMASSVSFMLVVIFSVCYAFKYDELVSLPEIQEQMSRELQNQYFLNPLPLTIVMLGGCLGGLLISLVLFTQQFFDERRKMRREALVTKARRLRYWKSGREVTLAEPVTPELRPTSFAPTHTMKAVRGRFHLFLSHGACAPPSRYRRSVHSFQGGAPSACCRVCLLAQYGAPAKIRCVS